MFYGRLKKLKGTALAEVICELVHVYFDISLYEYEEFHSILVNYLTSSSQFHVQLGRHCISN
jgi:hypothetical protein